MQAVTAPVQSVQKWWFMVLILRFAQRTIDVMDFTSLVASILYGKLLHARHAMSATLYGKLLRARSKLLATLYGKLLCACCEMSDTAVAYLLRYAPMRALRNVRD
eukprot:2173989-Rhodomonas_salina.3